MSDTLYNRAQAVGIWSRGWGSLNREFINRESSVAKQQGSVCSIVTDKLARETHIATLLPCIEPNDTACQDIHNFYKLHGYLTEPQLQALEAALYS
jgi:hypothetical protein